MLWCLHSLRMLNALSERVPAANSQNGCRGVSVEEYDLNRFLQAQAQEYNGYKAALAEIRRGRKERHWMWYIFPQLRGLGRSAASFHYAIADIHEAKAYFADPVLGSRLVEISECLLLPETDDPCTVFGCPDDMKLRSCMTLFREAAPECDVFQKVLNKYFAGKPDPKTLQILKEQGPA